MANAFFTVPAGTWEDGSLVTGTDLRRGAMFGTTGGATAMATRGGVRPSRGNPLGATLPGGMFVRVQPGVAAVPAAATEGAYIVSLPAQQDLAVTAAHATQARIDTVGLEVVPGSPDTWRLRMLDGAPSAGTPVAPDYSVVGTAGGAFLPLYDVRVNAAVSVPTSVTDRRSYAAATGGVVSYPGLMALSKASRDTVAAGLPVGTVLYDDTALAVQVVTSSRDLMPIAQDPTLTTIAFTAGVGVTITGAAFSPGYHNPDKTFTAPRSGWAYIGFQGDVQGVGNAGFGYVQILAGGNPIPDDQSSTPVGFFASSADRYYLNIKPRVPMWVVEGTAYALSLNVRADLTGGWLFNGGNWAIAIVS